MRRAPAPRSLRASFSLFAPDAAAIDTAVESLRRRGLRIDEAKFIRGLLHFTPAQDLFDCAVAQYRADEQESTPRRAAVVRRTSVNHLGSGATKLEGVMRRLAKADILMNDSYVLRALLRRLPSLKVLTTQFEQFLEEYPDTRWLGGPRGPYRKRK
jgi:hypothetical protein